MIKLKKSASFPMFDVSGDERVNAIQLNRKSIDSLKTTKAFMEIAQTLSNHADFWVNNYENIRDLFYKNLAALSNSPCAYFYTGHDEQSELNNSIPLQELFNAHGIPVCRIDGFLLALENPQDLDGALNALGWDKETQDAVKSEFVGCYNDISINLP